MQEPLLFLTVTHPSQFTRQRSSINAFASKQNSRKKRLQAVSLEKQRGRQISISTEEETDADDEEHGLILIEHEAQTPVWQDESVICCETEPLDIELIRTIGGFRGDPVKPYPIEVKDSKVPRLVDYFVQVFAPVYLWRSDLIETGTLDNFRRDYWQRQMHDPGIFQNILALCQANLDLELSPGSPPSGTVLRLHGNVIRSLQKKLACKQSHMDDVCFLTIIGLLTIDQLYSDWKSFEANLKGLRQIVRLRGGVDTLGWQGFPKWTYAYYEFRWASHVGQQTEAEVESHTTPVLTYLEYPFPSEICTIISMLPAGFRDICMTRMLSVQVIELLGRLPTWASSNKRPGRESKSSKHLRALEAAKPCIGLLRPGMLNPMEEYVCVGVMLYLDTFNETPLSAFRRTNLVDYMSKVTRFDAQTCDMDCLTWVAMVIAATPEPFGDPLPKRWLLLDQILQEDERTHSWEYLRPILSRYFWDDAFEEDWKRTWQEAMGRMIKFLERDRVQQCLKRPGIAHLITSSKWSSR